MPALPLTPLPTLHLTTHQIPSSNTIPNTTPHAHPLYIYHSVYPPTTPPSTLEAHLRTNALAPQWRYTMYTRTHYHSTTHEVLCVYRGKARLLFGGEENPGKVEAEVGAGDVVVVPAGVGHRLLEDLSEGGEEGGFCMVGSYPEGCAWDMCYGGEGESKEGMAEKVKAVKWFEKDPLYGRDGPVLWGEELEKKREL